jgi:hypothetical protein
MAVTVYRPDNKQPRKWQAFCVDHQEGINSSKPSCINWAEQHVKDFHPGEKVVYQ